MKIHLAQKSDYPFIKQLWQYSFGFSLPFLQWSLDNMLSAMQVYIAEENGEEKAAAAAIPMSISNADKTVRASYLCGCTTAPEYRGQGIMRNLVSAYLSRLRERVYRLVCVCRLTIKRLSATAGAQRICISSTRLRRSRYRRIR